MKIRTKFLVFLTVSLVVGGCSQGNRNADNPEDLLAAEGTWHMVDESQPAPSPQDMHMAARGQVNPAETSSRRSYTSKPQAADMDENIHFRVLRLENEVAGLRGDFDQLLPPLSNLITSDEQLGRTINSIGARQKARAMQPPPKPVPPPPSMAGKRPAPATAPPPPAVPSAPRMTAKPAQAQALRPAAGSGTAVTNVRFGQHPGKTRMVLDVTAPFKFSYDLDNNENLLLIELEGATWEGDVQKSLAKNPLVKGYTAQNSGSGGTALAVELKKPVKIGMATALKPNSTYNHHRAVFDLSAL